MTKNSDINESNELIAQYIAREELKAQVELGLTSVTDAEHKIQLTETLTNISIQLDELMQNESVAQFVVSQSELSEALRTERIESIKSLVPIYFH